MIYFYIFHHYVLYTGSVKYRDIYIYIYVRLSYFHIFRKFIGIKKENILSFDLIQSSVLTVEEMQEFLKIDVDLRLLLKSPTGKDLRISRLRKILEKVQRFCDDYESRVISLGGIGFFLGGIGPDGHIAFNQEGAAHDSTTRLVNFNYPTAAGEFIISIDISISVTLFHISF